MSEHVTGVRRAGFGPWRSSAGPGQTFEQRVIKRATTASTPPAALEVDADLARPAIRRARLERASVGVAHDVALVLQHDPRMRAHSGNDALGHLRRQWWIALECDRGIGDIRGVDRCARLSVTLRGVSNVRAATAHDDDTSATSEARQPDSSPTFSPPRHIARPRTEHAYPTIG
jgi:hypothetical protein